MLQEKKFSEDSKALVMKEVRAVAIAELRYEYALNILHKFGASQTRVGLTFRILEHVGLIQ